MSEEKTEERRDSTMLSRRDLLKVGGLVATGVAASGVLTACAPTSSPNSGESQTGDAGGSDLTVNSGHDRIGTPSFLIPPDPLTAEETKEFDVVVIGAGAAGVTAALSAREAGASVALLQKESLAVCQGNAGAGINLAASNPVHVANLISHLTKSNAYRSKNALVKKYVMNSGEAVQWVIDRALEKGAQVNDIANANSMALIKSQGYDITFVTSNFGPKPYTAGDGMKALAEVALDAGVEIFYSTPAEQLAVENGAVVGVLANYEGVVTQFNGKKGVIVATGDYQSDMEMSNYYQPDMRYFERKQFNKTGDGHKMIIWAGGCMENIAHTKMLHDFDAGPSSMCDMPFLAVKNNGMRFVDETVGMSLLNNFLKSEEDAGWYSQIFDADYMTAAASWPGKLVDPEGLKNYMPEDLGEKVGVFSDIVRTFVADSIDELADKLELTDKEAFLATVERYNNFVDQGFDEEYGKAPQWLIPVRTAPFYGIHRHIRVSAICSGVEVDENHQCLTPKGETIPGLYAVGNVSGGFYGGIDYPLDIFGMSLGRCYTEGYVVGKAVALG